MLELEDSLTFGMVLVQGRGDLLPLLELVLDGHHEAVEDGAGKQATSNEKEQQSTNKRTIKKNCSVNPTTDRARRRLFSNLVGRGNRKEELSLPVFLLELMMISPLSFLLPLSRKVKVFAIS